MKGKLSMLKKGFTLIELLIVIAIIGILAAVVLIGIDPVDKINAANDSKVQRDINALGNAMEAYAATHDGIYPDVSGGDIQDQLVTTGDLKVKLTAPNGYAAYTVSGGASGEAHGQVKSKRYVNAAAPGPYQGWSWCSNSGKAGPTATSANGQCPN